MKKNFTQISNKSIDDTDLPDSAFRTYAALKSYKFGENGRVFPSQSRIAAKLGKSREVINKHIQILRLKGYIDYYKRGYSLTNEYFFEEADSDEIITDDLKESVLGEKVLTPTVKENSQQELKESHTINTIDKNTKIKNTKQELDLKIEHSDSLANIEKMREELIGKGFNIKNKL